MDKQATVTLTYLRHLVAQDQLDEALRQLQALLENSPRLDEAILQSARFHDIRRQIRLGVVSYDNANLTKNQIRTGLLDLLREIEQQGEKPAIRQEMERAISIINSKNVVTGSISAGGNVQIGDHTTVVRGDDNRSRYFRYALFGFVLPGAFLFLLYWYFVLSRPFSLTVSVREARPVPGLPFREGTATLRYGDKTEKLPLANEVVFKQIPANQKGETARLTFESPGYQTLDTAFALSENLLLPIRRDSSLARIFGTVKDGQGNPVPEAQVTVQEMTVSTDAAGRFSLNIPPEKQRSEQRIRVFKNGFGEWDRTSPVFANEEIGIILLEK